MPSCCAPLGWSKLAASVGPVSRQADSRWPLPFILCADIMAFPHGTARCWSSRMRVCRRGQPPPKGSHFPRQSQDEPESSGSPLFMLIFSQATRFYHAEQLLSGQKHKCCAITLFVFVSLQGGGGLQEGPRPSVRDRRRQPLRTPSAPTSAAFN